MTRRLRRVCLYCEKRRPLARLDGYFCSNRCAAKWALCHVGEAEGGNAWCDRHGWYWPAIDDCARCLEMSCACGDPRRRHYGDDHETNCDLCDCRAFREAA